MSNQQALVVFLRALVAAKKSLALYPPGSETAMAWIERLRRSLDDAFRQGLIFPIRVARDSFVWAGGELPTTDRAWKGLRFEMQSGGIGELSRGPSVENWELQAMRELLNKPTEQLASITAAHSYLRDRAVVRVSVGGAGLGGLPVSPDLDTGWGTGTEESGSGASLAGTDGDTLDLLVESILELVDKRFESLAYDRTGLLEWFQTVSRGGRVDRLYAAVNMLGAMAQGSGDREVRARTTFEALMLLPDATLAPFFTDCLLPGAASDLTAFNLLTQVTEDELRGIARHVPRERLVALTTELLEYPWEEGKRLRLLEAITLTLEPGAGAWASPAGPGPSNVSLVVDLLRREPPMGPMDVATEYLRFAGPEGVEVFTALLAEEPHRRVRIRMCEVLARVGAPAIPPLLSRLADKRWFVVRNALYTLRKIGHASVFPAIVAVLEHPDPRVRLEAVRVAVQVGGAAARAPGLRPVHDPDASGRPAAISAVGAPGNDGAVPELRKVLLGSGARSEDDAEVQLGTIRALASIGTSAALSVLEAAVSRRTWFWRRAERRVRDLAAQTLSARKPRARVSPKAVDDR